MQAPARASCAAAIPVAPRSTEVQANPASVMADSPPIMPFMLSRKLTAFMSATSSTRAIAPVMPIGNPMSGSPPPAINTAAADACPSGPT